MQQLRTSLCFVQTVQPSAAMSSEEERKAARAAAREAAFRERQHSLQYPSLQWVATHLAEIKKDAWLIGDAEYWERQYSSLLSSLAHLGQHAGYEELDQAVQSTVKSQEAGLSRLTLEPWPAAEIAESVSRSATCGRCGKAGHLAATCYVKGR
jgi:hypothetical protein